MTPFLGQLFIVVIILFPTSGCVDTTSQEDVNQELTPNIDLQKQDMSSGMPATTDQALAEGDQTLAGVPTLDYETGRDESMGGETPSITETDMSTAGTDCLTETCTDEDPDCDGLTGGASCQSICGDGLKDEEEECDFGQLNTAIPCPYGDLDCIRCSPQCTLMEAAYCGDHVVNGPEDCEEDQLELNTLCTHQCENFSCGDNLPYTPMRVQGWPVCVNEELITQNPILYQQVINALDEDLIYIQTILPQSSSEWLKRVNIWIELSTDRFPGAVYHPNPVWLIQNGYPAEWALGIQIANAQNYMTWVQEQPAIILHELTHAWHHQNLTPDYLPLINAYQDAMDEGLYDSVEYVHGQYLEAYATSNVQEYFAELTEAWFWTNDYYPFIRSELLMHDPVGASLIEAAWELND